MSHQIIMSGVLGDKVAFALSEEKFRSFTVRDLKRKFQQTWDVPEYDSIRLTYSGKSLFDDDKLIADYGIDTWAIVQMFFYMVGGGESPEEGNMGDRDQKNRSMDRLNDFQDPPLMPKK